MAQRKLPKASSMRATRGTQAVRDVPTGVQIISVLTYISAVVLILLALLFFIGAGLSDEVLKLGGEELSSINSGLLAGIAAFIGVLFFIIGVLLLFVGRGLWKRRAWARIVAIILAIFGVLNYLLVLFQGAILGGIFWLIVYGVIGGYLLFNKDVQAAFR